MEHRQHAQLPGPAWVRTTVIRVVRAVMLMLAATVAGAVGVNPAVAAPRAAPFGFMGTMADGPLDEPGVDFEREVAAMRACGVESLRVAVYWNALQPYASLTDVPADQRPRFVDIGGVPTDFSRADRLIGPAATAGLIVMPVVLGAPVWARQDPSQEASPPRDDAPFQALLRALIGRYGPDGSLWSPARPVSLRPVRSWQIWNEVNINRYWYSPVPFGPRYARLLRASFQTIRAADPGAKVVMAGFANESWKALTAAYRAGVAGSFDVAAVHPFSGRLSNVLKIIRLNRAAMARNGDATRPIILSELTWPSALGKTKNTIGFETTERGQAVRLANAYRALLTARRSLRLARVHWYTWLSADRDSPNSFSWSGLRRLGPLAADAPINKPSFGRYCAIARRVQGR